MFRTRATPKLIMQQTQLCSIQLRHGGRVYLISKNTNKLNDGHTKNNSQHNVNCNFVILLILGINH